MYAEIVRAGSACRAGSRVVKNCYFRTREMR